MTAGRFFNILEDDEIEESMQWCGYCAGIISVFVVAVYVFFAVFVMIKNGN
jgi:hypothetical protein